MRVGLFFSKLGFSRDEICYLMDKKIVLCGQLDNKPVIDWWCGEFLFCVLVH